MSAAAQGRLAGKIALITGAAGVQGRVAALSFARHGARVALTDLEEVRVQKVADEVVAAGGEAFAVACDVTSEPAVVSRTRRPSWVTATKLDSTRSTSTIEVTMFSRS